ncbi:hypothetical protein Glove_9g61 [Diversispora epigaea]|uniref:Uncharacterized protein n=1 Tax=Diversispora epigaea TaxID=1348612 RepID=A0A397JNV8_9GLOM|nr:hypothetical protein Glove_9g61 [Diversispora epigaea]
MQNALNAATFFHDLSLKSFFFDNESHEVPLEKTSEMLLELLDHNNIGLTENSEEILPSEFFEQKNRLLYPIAPKMSFNTWINLDNIIITQQILLHDTTYKNLIYYLNLLRHIMQNALNAATFFHDLSLKSFFFDNESHEVPLEKTSEMLLELLDHNNIGLTENSEEILPSEFFEQKNRLLYPIAPKMSFNTWINLDKWLENHGLEQGFAFTITHSEKDKKNGLPRLYMSSKLI